MEKVISLILAVMVVSISYAQAINGTWKGMLNAGNQKLEIVFHFNYQKDGNSTAEMDVPAQGALGIPVNLKFLSTDSVSLEVMALLMAYTGKLTDGTIKGTFNQFGMPFPLDLKRNKKNLIKEYPGLNHLFQHFEPDTAMDYYKIEETCSLEVLQDIAEWINSL